MGFWWSIFKINWPPNFLMYLYPKFVEHPFCFAKFAFFRNWGGGAFYRLGGPRNLEFSVKSHFTHFVVS